MTGKLILIGNWWHLDLTGTQDEGATRELFGFGETERVVLPTSYGSTCSRYEVVTALARLGTVAK